MRRYNGNTGQYTHIPDHIQPRPAPPREPPVQEAPPPPPPPKKMPPPNQIGSGIQSLLSNVFAQGFDTGDLLLFAVLFLMYRESRDKELLIIMGGMFLL